MTVIVYRAGIIAADGGSYAGSTRHSFARKVARGPDGTLYGCTGVLAECEAYLDWVRSGCAGSPPAIRRTKEAESDDAIHVLRVRPGRDPEQVTGYGAFVWHGAPYAAIGSACEAALGALHAGATAVQAVEAAIAHSQWAHGPVRWVGHDGFGSDQATPDTIERVRSMTTLSLKQETRPM